MAGITMDAGGLLAIERGDRATAVKLKRAIDRGERVVVPAGVLAQVWRDGRRQAVLSKFLFAPEVSIEALDERRARAAGALCGVTKTSDIVDASVVVGARIRGDVVMTSDPEDLRRLDSRLPLIVV